MILVNSQTELFFDVEPIPSVPQCDELGTEKYYGKQFVSLGIGYDDNILDDNISFRNNLILNFD